MGLINFGRSDRDNRNNDKFVTSSASGVSSKTSPSTKRGVTNNPPKKYWLTGNLSQDSFPSVLRSISVSDIGYNYDKNLNKPNVSFKYSWKYSRKIDNKVVDYVIKDENQSTLPWWKMNQPVKIGDYLICEVSLVVNGKVVDKKDYNLGVVNSRPMGADFVYLSESKKSYDPLQEFDQTKVFYIKTNAYGYKTVKFKLTSVLGGELKYITKYATGSVSETKSTTPSDEDYYITSTEFKLTQTLKDIDNISVEIYLEDGNKFSKRVRDSSTRKQELLDIAENEFKVIEGQEPFYVDGVYPLYNDFVDAANQSKLYSYEIYEFDYCTLYSPTVSATSRTVNLGKDAVEKELSVRREREEFFSLAGQQTQSDNTVGRSCLVGYILYGDAKVYHKETSCLDKTTIESSTKRASDLYDKLNGYVKAGAIDGKGQILVGEDVPYVHVEHSFVPGESCENWDCEKNNYKRFKNDDATYQFYTDVDLEDIAPIEACDLPVCMTERNECPSFAKCCRTRLDDLRERYIWDLFYCRIDYSESGNDDEYRRCVEDAKWDFCMSARMRCFGDLPGDAAFNCRSQGFEVPSVSSLSSPDPDILRITGSDVTFQTAVGITPPAGPTYNPPCGLPLVPYFNPPCDPSEEDEWLECDNTLKKELGKLIDQSKKSCLDIYKNAVSNCNFVYSLDVKDCRDGLNVGPDGEYVSIGDCLNAASAKRRKCISGAGQRYLKCMRAADCSYCKAARQICFTETCESAVGNCKALGYEECPSCGTPISESVNIDESNPLYRYLGPVLAPSTDIDVMPPQGAACRDCICNIDPYCCTNWDSMCETVIVKYCREECEGPTGGNITTGSCCILVHLPDPDRVFDYPRHSIWAAQICRDNVTSAECREHKQRIAEQIEDFLVLPPFNIPKDVVKNYYDVTGGFWPLVKCSEHCPRFYDPIYGPTGEGVIPFDWM